jgi:hypothetical protein
MHFGFAPEHVERLFEPNFTLSSAALGTDAGRQTSLGAV